MPGTGDSSACPSPEPEQGRTRRWPYAAHPSGIAWATPVFAAAGVVDSATSTGLGYSVLPIAAWWLHDARNGSAAATDFRREPRARNAALAHARCASVRRLPAAVCVLTVRPTRGSATRVRHAAHSAVNRPDTVFAAAAARAGPLDTTATSKRRAIFTTRRDAAVPAGAGRAILVPTATSRSRGATGPRCVLRFAAAAAAPAGLRDVILVPATTGPACLRGVLRVAAASDDGPVEVAS
jgi:hypothetical protein